MDPDATWREYCQAVRESRLHDADELCDALCQWLDRGGYPPQWDSEPDYYLGYFQRDRRLRGVR